MRCIHRYLLAASFLLFGAVSASAQTAVTPPQPDTAKVTTLETVTVTDKGNWFTRADDLRRTVIAAIDENRRLSGVLREQNAQIVKLSTHLDSLKRVEFIQTARIAALDDSVAATRARRRALEAKILAAETRQPNR